MKIIYKGALAVTATIIVAILGWSYYQYRSDNNSQIFKQKVTYAKNQSLTYDSLSVSILKPGNLYDASGALAINYEVKNNSSNSVDLSNYKFSVITNGNFPPTDVHTGTPRFIPPGGNVNGWYVVDPWDAGGYTGPLALTVSKKPNHISKTIVIRP